MSKFLDAITMGFNYITDLRRPTDSDHAATKKYVDDYSPYPGRTLFNPDFDRADPVDSTLPLGWERSGSGIVVRSSEKQIYGVYSAKFTCVGNQTVSLMSSPVRMFNPTTTQLLSLYDAVSQIVYTTSAVLGVLTLSVLWQTGDATPLGTWTVGSKDFSTAVPKTGAIFGKADPSVGTVEGRLIINLTTTTGTCVVWVAGSKLEEAISSISVGTLDIRQSPIQFTNSEGITVFGHAVDEDDTTVKQFGEVTLEVGGKIIGGGGSAVLDAAEGMQLIGDGTLDVTNVPFYASDGATLVGNLQVADLGPGDTYILLRSELSTTLTLDSGKNILFLSTGPVRFDSGSYMHLNSQGDIELEPNGNHVNLLSGGIKFPDASVLTSAPTPTAPTALMSFAGTYKRGLD